MGWASYQEDIESRYFGARAADSDRSPRPIKPVKLAVRSKAAAAKPPAPQSPAQGEPMKTLKDFTVASARPLPFIVLADVSGSMATDGKIDALNTALSEMLSAFSEEDSTRAEIHVAVVTFGHETKLHLPLQPAANISFQALTAKGKTPLGPALDLVTALVEDKNVIPSRAYRPTIILVSDGQPDPGWEKPLSSLLASERASKAQRFAMAIGADADHDVLRAFLADPESRVFEAQQAREIRKFFKWVTMSVAARSRSAQPNVTINLDPLDIDDYGTF